MNTKRLCKECGAELAPDDARGLCPRCLLKVGLGTQPEPGATVAEGATPARRPLPVAGEQLGRYRIVRALGRGGMGVVYEAEEQDTGRRVALKVLARQLDSPEHRARFLREGRLAASINHPNSVYVYGTEEIDGTPTIAMELVTGGTLQEKVKQRGPMPVPAAVDAILQIIAGLETAQAIGILHRDIKPGNCFEDTDGTIKIGDFGLSISTAARAETSVTAAGTMVGTPAFCSPEQLRGEELNARSDLYSVGVTLFYLLTARVPFEGHNLAQLIANVLEKRAPSPRQFRNEVPSGLAKAVLRCLEKQPGERFRTYDELRRALAPYGSTAPTPATFGLRFLAGAIDLGVLNAVSMTVMFLTGGNPFDWLNLVSQGPPRMLLVILPSLVGSLLYYGLLEGFWGAAVGKAICRLRVVGPERNVPGVRRALVRALIYVVVPMLPSWLVSGFNPRAYFESPPLIQASVGISFYLVLALLFCTARRRNGFAAVQDLAVNTRVISRLALESRIKLVTVELPPPAAETGPTVGPYHVLETLGQSDGTKWLLAYDLRLLRKVWLRVVPPGTPPVPAEWRNIGRVGRLRWLSGRRAPEENWDAFEAVGGRPLLHLAQTRQPWSQVRFWLYDLARELGAAARDGTLPVLALDRVWITADGRAKLLDFPAPGLGSTVRFNESTIQPVNIGTFLGAVAAAALTGRPETAGEAATAAAVPLPLHARQFLDTLPQLPDGDAVAGALKPLLSRVAEVTRWRRAGIVAGCLAFPVLAHVTTLFGLTMMEQWSRTNPGLAALQELLQTRASLNAQGMKDTAHPTDRQFAIYIAGHYRDVITNEAAWTSGFALTLIKGESRRFAERSVVEHPAPNETELREAETIVEKYLHKSPIFTPVKQLWFPFALLTVLLAVYVGVPALVAALLFRGGLVLLAARVTFVREDGVRASRLRVFCRALAAWSPLAVPLFLSVLSFLTHSVAEVALSVGVVCALTVLSVALPERGLPDRLAGTWPVPR